VGRVQALLSSFHDDGEPRLGRAQVPSPRGLGYHNFGAVIEGGIRAWGVTMETLGHVFPLHQAHPPTAPPAPAQGPPSPPTSGTPLMPNSPGEVHVVVDLPNTLEIVVVSFEDEAMEGFEAHLEEEEDPEEDQDIDKAVMEQQRDQEIDKMLVEQQVQKEDDEVGSGVSDRSFYSGVEPEDESDLNYDPSRDQ